MKKLFLLFILSAFSACNNPQHTSAFVSVCDGQFLVRGKPYYFIGTNFWYGAILGSEGRGGDRVRLGRELDSLRALGVTNLRVLAGADGTNGRLSKVEPALQTTPGVYDDALLDGLDYLMAELGRREMTAVLYLNNSWEWSGGYSQYLMWSGAGEAPIPRNDGWKAYMEYVKGFVVSNRAKELFSNHVRNIVSRTNRYTGLAYADDPALFSWQIGNEPRVFAAENKAAFAEWIGQVAREIRALDANHMISTGSEGRAGCEGNLELWQKIHSFPEISYMTIHIWPYNWSWVNVECLTETLPQAIAKTTDYIDEHLAVARTIGKPVVLEEFGFPRNGKSFTPGLPVTGRDGYYSFVFDRVVSSHDAGDVLAGCNFWAWGGLAEPRHIFWQEGDDYCGDPAQEEQGLNSVFLRDSSTTELIRRSTARLE